MNSVLLALMGIVTMVLGISSKYLARRLYVLDDNRATPAHAMRDGVDYVPTNHVHRYPGIVAAWVMFGLTIANGAVGQYGCLPGRFDLDPTYACTANQRALAVRLTSVPGRENSSRFRHPSEFPSQLKLHRITNEYRRLQTCYLV